MDDIPAVSAFAGHLDVVDGDVASEHRVGDLPVELPMPVQILGHCAGPDFRAVVAANVEVLELVELVRVVATDQLCPGGNSGLLGGIFVGAGLTVFMS